MRIGFLGGGQMAESIIAGLSHADLNLSYTFNVYDINNDRLSYLSDLYKVVGAASNGDVISCSDIIFIAVKPQYFDDVSKILASSDLDGKIIISMMAGVGISTIADAIKSQCKIVRIMPNTPVMINKGTVLVSYNDLVSDEEKSTVLNMLNGLGLAMELPEKLIDAGTGISGCGPAYFYLILEGMMAGGVEAGLSASVSLKLAASTMMGSAAMVMETSEHPSILRDKVTSPGGSTIEGVRVLEEYSIRAAMINAVAAGHKKSVELGGGNKIG